MADWHDAGREPDVSELLEDEVMTLLLAHDKLDIDDVWASVNDARQALRRRRGLAGATGTSRSR